MPSWVLWVLKRAAVLLAMIAVTLIAVRIYDTQRAPPLELWHTYAPSEMDADEIDQADWDQYLAAEQAVFDDVRAEVTAQLDPAERGAVQPVFRGQPGVSGPLRAGLEPVLRAGARRRPGRRRGAAARAHRRALQPAPHRAPLP